jgi:hypothetical protein
MNEPIEKEQTPIMIKTSSSRSYDKLIRQLFERTQNKLLTPPSDPFNSILRETVQQWSQKRVFGFMLMDLRKAQWFNLWLEHTNIIDDEFMVYWPMSDNAISKDNDRILLTNKRFVIFTTEKPLRIERESLLSNVAKYEVVEREHLYDVLIQFKSGDHLRILRAKSCPLEYRVKALLD